MSGSRDTKPVTIRASAAGQVTTQQQEGLDNVVNFLLDALYPGPLLPLTGRIVIEWGVEEELARLRE